MYGRKAYISMMPEGTCMSCQALEDFRESAYGRKAYISMMPKRLKRGSVSCNLLSWCSFFLSKL